MVLLWETHLAQPCHCDLFPVVQLLLLEYVCYQLTGIPHVGCYDYSPFSSHFQVQLLFPKAGWACSRISECGSTFCISHELNSSLKNICVQIHACSYCDPFPKAILFQCLIALSCHRAW